MIKEKMKCCQMECKKIPEYHIQNIGKGADYDDYTHSCKEHLPEMVDLYDIVAVWRLK